MYLQNLAMASTYLVMLMQIATAEFAQFEDRANMLTARSDMSATLFEGDLFDDGEPRIYLVGGCDADQICDSIEDFCFCPDLTDKTEYYLPESDKWMQAQPALRERYRFGAAALNGKLYIAGGRDANDTIITAIDMYDPVTDTWTFLRDWDSATSDNGVFAEDDYIYLVGGYEQDYNPTGRVYKMSTSDPYDLEVMTSMDTPRGDIGVMTLVTDDGTDHYVVGGAGLDYCVMLDDIESYNVQTDAWTQHPPFAKPRADMAVGVIQGELFVIAGEAKDEQCNSAQNISGISYPVDDVERFIPGVDDEAGTWTVEEDVETSRFRFTGVSYKDEIILFGGQTYIPDAVDPTGTPPTYNILDTTSVYKPKLATDPASTVTFSIAVSIMAALLW